VITSGWKHARTLLLVSAAVLIPALAGCEAGTSAPTQDFHQPTDGAGLVQGGIAIRNMFVLGAPLGSSLKPGQSASLFFALVNESSTPDKLLSVSAPGSATAVKLVGAPISVVQGSPVLLTGPQPQVYLTGLTQTLTSGSNLAVTLTFQREGSVTVQVPVIAQAASYATFSPPPSPAPSKSPTASPTASPSPTATP
jgi:hypothetical protein